MDDESRQPTFVGEGMTSEVQAKETRVVVEYRPGRWGQVFHLFDLNGREISLLRKEAVQMARQILKIAREKEV